MIEEYGYDEVVIDRYGSVIGFINGNRPGKTVLMDGHIDNVDVIDEAEWKHAPLAERYATERYMAAVPPI